MAILDDAEQLAKAIIQNTDSDHNLYDDLVMFYKNPSKTNIQILRDSLRLVAMEQEAKRAARKIKQFKSNEESVHGQETSAEVLK